MILGLPETELKENKGIFTASEIAQQPVVWRKVADQLSNNRIDINSFLKPILSDANARIILTGAGTSAYVGEAAAPNMSKALNRPVEAISTTDIVATPDLFLLKDHPTLVISFARSGNSPESVGAVDLADQLIDNVFHLIITCNKDGALANGDYVNRFKVILPDETNDKSFAMTSSFTSMLLTTALIFDLDNGSFEKSLSLSEQVLSTNSLEEINNISKTAIERVVCLGAGGLLGIAREASLKILELSNGNLDCYFESPLGFRHGPKLVINGETLVILLGTESAYSQKYDTDLKKEIIADNQAGKIIDLYDELGCAETRLDDFWLSFPYILYCQVFAFYKSINLGITPDNPCPTGEANRVVQGVTIYPFNGSIE